jgi:hypothetical protein
MEKFSVFNDRVSAVNPFAPSVYRPSGAALATGAALLLVRLPLLLLAGAALAAVSAVASAVRERRRVTQCAPDSASRSRAACIL